MARHRDELSMTREALLHRYAAAAGCAIERARLLHTDTNIESLRIMVESREADVQYPGRRRSFPRSQPTTSLQGLSR